jgi:lipopolysaccharide export LptBFGC system permease protein LptF
MTENKLRKPEDVGASWRDRVLAASRLDLLVWGSVLGPLGVALALLTGVGLLVQVGAALASAAAFPPVTAAAAVVGWLAPAALELALPLAFLVGWVVALGRWRDDGTWIALCTCGVPGRRLLRPAFFGALGLALPLAVLSHGLAPAGRRAAAARLVQACSEVELPPGGFLSLAGATLHRPLSGGVVVLLREGLLSSGRGNLEPRSGGVLLRLGPGEALPGGPKAPTMRFEEALIPIPLSVVPRRIELTERSDAELRALVQQRAAAGQNDGFPSLILLKRSSQAFALLLLPAVALPLALRWRGRALPVLGIALFTWTLVRTGDGLVTRIGAWPAAALPVLGLLGLATVLWAGWRDR